MHLVVSNHKRDGVVTMFDQDSDKTKLQVALSLYCLIRVVESITRLLYC